MKSAVLLLGVFLAVSYTIALSPGKPDGPPVDPTEVKPSSLSISPFPPTRCGPICRMYCPNGFVTNSNGCPICKCKPGKCSRLLSRITCRSCRYGRTYYTDKNGCRRCRCKRKPVCPMYKCRACPNGYVKNSRGCNTCTCKPGGGRPCKYGKRTYRDGQSYKKDCNTCLCRNGRSLCTKKGCNTVCPKRKCRPCPFNRYGRDSNGCQNCVCTMLPNFPGFPRRDIP